MKKYTNLLKRFGVLAVLVCCLGFVVFSSGTQSVFSRPCCTSCDVYPGDDEYAYCNNFCSGATSRACVSQCLTRINNCWSVCTFSCGGGGGTLCGNGQICPSGTFCIDGYNCVY